MHNFAPLTEAFTVLRGCQAHLAAGQAPEKTGILIAHFNGDSLDRHYHPLPQMSESLCLPDGGLETTLVFHDGMDLPFTPEAGKK